MKPEEIIKVAQEKNKLAKDLAQFKDDIAAKAHKRKFDFTKYLYEEKQKYTDRQFDQSMIRVKEINKLRNNHKS